MYLPEIIEFYRMNNSWRGGFLNLPESIVKIIAKNVNNIRVIYIWTESVSGIINIEFKIVLLPKLIFHNK